MPEPLTLSVDAQLPWALRGELLRRFGAGWTGRIELDLKEGRIVGYTVTEKTRL